GGTDRPLHLLEARVPVDVHGDVSERRVRDAVDLDRLRTAVGTRRVEYVRFFPRAHGIVQRRDDPVRDQVGDRQEGRVVEDLVVRLARLRVLLSRAERVNLGLQNAEAALMDHCGETNILLNYTLRRSSKYVKLFLFYAVVVHVGRLGLRFRESHAALL